MTDKPNVDILTPREREVLTMIAEGDSLPEIASKLHRSLKTIESHRLSLGRKLEASNRVELAKIAIAAGLVSISPSDQSPAPGGSNANLAESELEWLEQLNRAVFNSTGSTFIKRFCNAASLLPGVTIAAACTPNPTHAYGTDLYQRYVIGMAREGVMQDPVVYQAEGTPCEAILKDGECCFSEGISRAFPNDAWLQSLNAEGYLGLQLERPDGSACGGFALIGRTPFGDMQAYRRVIEFFLPRLAGELDMYLQLDALRTRCEELESQVVSQDMESAPRDTGSKGYALPPSAAVLAEIAADVHDLAGPAFLSKFANSLCQRLGVKAAGICMFVQRDGEKALASAFYSVDGEIAENLVYSYVDMPCEKALEHGHFSLPQGVLKVYPDDQYFIDMGIDAYIGTRLSDAEGSTVGTMWVSHTQAIKDSETIDFVLKRFAPRVGAEVANFQRLEELMREQEKLRERLAGPKPIKMANL